jgi:hypothetical protein
LEIIGDCLSSQSGGSAGVSFEDRQDLPGLRSGRITTEPRSAQLRSPGTGD